LRTGKESCVESKDEMHLDPDSILDMYQDDAYQSIVHHLLPLSLQINQHVMLVQMPDSPSLFQANLSILAEKLMLVVEEIEEFLDAGEQFERVEQEVTTDIDKRLEIVATDLQEHFMQLATAREQVFLLYDVCVELDRVIGNLSTEAPIENIPWSG
jgi:hypothetical protein